MITFSIKKFSDFCGNGWWDREELKPAPKFDEIKNTYNKAKKLLDNLIEKNYMYLERVIIQYGEETDDVVCSEYILTCAGYEIQLVNKNIYIDDENEYCYVNFKSLSLDEQMEFIEKINEHVQNLTPKRTNYR